MRRNSTKNHVGKAHSAGPAAPRPFRMRSRVTPRDALTGALGGLHGRPLRSVLSALGIAIGIGAMVAVVGIGRAGQAAVVEDIRALGTNLLTAAPGQTFGGGQALLPENADAMVARIGPVTSATATGKVEATVRRTDRVDANATGGIAVLAGRDDLLGTVGGRMAAGRYLDPAVGKYPAAVLGSVAATRLAVDAPGGLVWLGGQWFTVLGILETLPLAPELDRAVLVGWEAARTYLGFDGHPTTVYARARDDQVPAVRDVLAATVSPGRPHEVKVSRPSDALAAQRAAEGTGSVLLLGLGAVALLVGGIGVANTMVVAVLERRREIGLRRALGAHQGQIRGQFLAEAVCLAGLGGLVGVASGTAVAVVYAQAHDWPLTVPLPELGGAVAAAAVIGALAGWFPAARAARLPPTRALSTE